MASDPAMAAALATFNALLEATERELLMVLERGAAGYRQLGLSTVRSRRHLAQALVEVLGDTLAAAIADEPDAGRSWAAQQIESLALFVSTTGRPQ